MINKVTQPIQFQGNLQKKNYFEGWYYKQVAADEKTVISFIPGIVLAEGDPHSFIQYTYVHIAANGQKEMRTGYLRYAIEDFVYNSKPFLIKIGGNIFSETLVSVHLEDGQFSVGGQLTLGPFQEIKRTVLMPSIMGFFAYIPKMECYHGVISMSHSVAGKLEIGNKCIDFAGGKGYLEKDWGTSFPEHYVWIQSNHFSDGSMSLVFSLADIPFNGFSFEGFLCNLTFGDEEFRFATYNGSRITVGLISEERVEVAMENRHAALTISAEILQAGELIAPTEAGMNKVIKEGLSGIVTIDFTDKKSGKEYHDIGQMAGIEIVR